MVKIGVACEFAEDGRVQVRRVQVEGQWHTVGQGRQWVDATGRHVLIMLHGETVREIVLHSGELHWELKPARQRFTIA